MKLLQKLVLAFICVFTEQVCAQDKPSTEKTDPPIETLDQLKAAIEMVLKTTRTPGVGIAMVNEAGPIWVTSLGKANLEENIDADSTTMFRIGSTSKMFVSLSILKLQEEGRVHLDDKVRDLVPEIAFENRWEETNPVRVAHLLEHTTGWDDIHLCEYGLSLPDSLGVKEGLDFHPHSRTSRWVPGTRMSYCNSGPPVAAYIVEKITGQSFEKYVEENFFRPMGMESMTYFESETYKKKGAALYSDNKPQDYWHIIMRASGSINASPRDMARMVRFFVNRAAVDSAQLISHNSLIRMETPSTTSGARAGLQIGYGLSNYSTPHKGFVYRSHNGGVNGGLTDLSYLPEQRVGYVVMINSSNSGALSRISDLIRDFQTRGLTTTTLQADSLMKDHPLNGYYVPINPRTQIFYFLERILSTQKIWTDQGVVHRKNLMGGSTSKYVPVSDTVLRSQITGLISLVKTSDPLAGDVVQAESAVLQPTSALSAFTPLVIACLWLIFVISSVLFGLVWGISYFRGLVAPGANILIRLWPLIASLMFLAAFVLIMLGISDPFESLGKMSAISVGIMISTIGFALASVWSVVIVIRAWTSSVNRILFWYCAASAILHLVVAVYFFVYGVIVLRTWA